MPECDHTKKDGAFVCPRCYADLNLHQDEIDARDRLFLTFKGIIKDSGKEKDMPLDRQTFDYLISKNSARIIIWIIGMLVDEKAKKAPKKEKTIMDIEKEKLKILKQIRDKL